MTPLGLTRRQAQALDVIRDAIAETGRSPSFQQIADRLGVKGKGHVHTLVHELIARGHLVKGRAHVNGTLKLALGAGQYQVGFRTAVDAEVRRRAAARGVTPEHLISSIVSEQLGGASS